MLVLLATFLVCCTLATAKSTNGSSHLIYDYIVVGGGTAGSVLANRLSANPSISVAVIEAGNSVLKDSRVTTTQTFGGGFNTDIDWNYTTTPQVFANNQSLAYHAGKDLGGTSTINGMVYLRPAAEEINAWSELGNPGLSWDSLLPYYEKSEHLQLPTASQVANGASFDASVHGFNGPLKVGWYSGLNHSGYGVALNTTLQSLGLTWRSDPNTGFGSGLAFYPSERDVALNIREDAARAYYWPVAGRRNLHTFTNTTALKVVLTENGSVRAEGVQVVLPSGEQTVLHARREVVLSAGTYRTPGLLEQSGIGNPIILQNLSITPNVVLPGVGQGLQDQWLVTLVYSPDVAGVNIALNTVPFTGAVTVADLFGDDLPNIEAQLLQDIPEYARILAGASNGATSVEHQQEILNLRADIIFNKSVPIAAIELTPQFAAGWVTMPFSTGSVHSSSNPSKPNLNPNFMQLPWDVLIEARLLAFLRKLSSTPPLQTITPTELVPGTTLVPVNASTAVWTAYFKEALAPVWHAVGSAGMRKLEYGGVVDEKYRVYGCDGLRIVDASVMPLQGNGNPTSTIYALAERAAEVILS